MGVLIKHSSAKNGAGHFYTAPGATPKARADALKQLKPPMKDWTYRCPFDGPGGYGPFLGAGYSKELGPIATNRQWMPFATTNRTPGALPLPLTVDSTTEGFKFSTPPVFNMGGHTYEPSTPQKTGQIAAQYYGNSQNNFRVAPAVLSADKTHYDPESFPTPDPEHHPEVAFSKVESFSDWAATASLTSTSGKTMSVTFATGSPLAFIHFDAKTDYGCVLFSNVPQEPVRSWYPEGYRCLSPAGVAIVISGAAAMNDKDTLKLSLKIALATDSVAVEHTVKRGDKKEDVAKALRQAFASASGASTLFEIGDLQGTEQPKGDFEFLVSPRDRKLVIKDTDVTVSPKAAEQIILIPQLRSVMPVDPKPGQTVIGLTIGSSYKHQEAEPRDAIFQASYALIAPIGGRWFYDTKDRLICDFTKVKDTEATRTLIACAMPTLGDDAYRQYDSQAAEGAANQLRRHWQKMQPYAFGCPRHLTNGKDDGTGTRLGPNDGNRFTPQVKTADGKTTVTTEFWYRLSYPAGRPPGAGGTLFCLFPHQWRAYASNTANILDTSYWGPTYWTVMGPMKLAGGSASDKDESKLAFTTTYVFPGILAHLPNVAKLDKDKVKFDVYDYPNDKAQQVVNRSLKDQMTLDTATPDWAADLSQPKNPHAYIPVSPSLNRKFSQDSYSWGKLVGLLGDLIPTARDLNHTDAVNAAVRQLNAQLGQWLSGDLVDATMDTPWPPGVERWQKGERKLAAFAGDQGLFNNQQFLLYDPQWASLIPYPTGFDAETLLNDHHFHYGYWIRAAAQLALAQARKLDPDNPAGTFIKNYGATVNLIIKDIANPLRGDQQGVDADATTFPNGPAMPFLRYFDGYSGHSWASGLRVNVIDQESVSEAISAWTGVIMWGEVINDAKIRDLGIWMYTQEVLSFYEYWMDCAEGRQDGSTYFPKGSEVTVNDDAYGVAIKGGLDMRASPNFFCHVFNGYRQMSTFFGWDPIFLAGIQWMPFHGGSLYLNSSDAAIQWKMGWQWKWAYGNSEYLVNNKDKPLATLKPGRDADAFVKELNDSVNNNDATKPITEGLRAQFTAIGFNVPTRGDEVKTGVRVIVTKVNDNNWTVACAGGIVFTAARSAASAPLVITGTVDEYRPTLFAPTWEQIAWQGISLIDPNGDSVFWDKPKTGVLPVFGSSKEAWDELEKAIGSRGAQQPNKGWLPMNGNAVSYSYYWISNSHALGVRDATASADYPFAVKFLGPKPSLSTPRPARYAVWNMTDSSRTVTFSDGHKMTVDPYAYKVDA